jgi:hypothetical protein
MGAIAGEIGFGIYKNEADDISFGDSTLSLQVARLGVRYTMDNLFYEPIFAPYAGAGAYIVSYKESLASSSFNGNTSPAPYYYVGGLFQLNWLDRMGSADSYIESGIENTSLFVEARKFIAAAPVQDPDFETDFDINFGLNIEF